MTPEEIAWTLMRAVRHAHNLLEEEGTDRQYVLEDTLVRMEKLARQLRGQEPLDYVPAYPMLGERTS